MGIERVPHDESGTDCASSDSFDDHGIERGEQLISRTHNRLAVGELTFEPTESFFDRLEEAFIWAYLGSVDQSGVPEHLSLAIDDAKAVTYEQFRDRSDADLRNESCQPSTSRLPAFTARTEKQSKNHQGTVKVRIVREQCRKRCVRVRNRYRVRMVFSSSDSPQLGQSPIGILAGAV